MRTTISRLSPLAAALAALLLAGTAAAQVNCNEGLDPLDTSAGSRMGAMDFIRSVAANEVAYSKAFLNYTYTLEVSVQTLQGDTVDGEFHQVSTIDYDTAGNRRETVTGGPTNTMTRAQLGDRDVEALRESFTLTPALLAERDIVYAGRQQIGNINAAAFDILPRDGKATPSRFAGRVWVRVNENAIIRVCGRVGGGPFGALRYRVTRTQLGEQHWFPATIAADEDAATAAGKVHVRVSVKYTDYKLR
jgi:hypothetical protein